MDTVCRSILDPIYVTAPFESMPTGSHTLVDGSGTPHSVCTDSLESGGDMTGCLHDIIAMEFDLDSRRAGVLRVEPSKGFKSGYITVFWVGSFDDSHANVRQI